MSALSDLLAHACDETLRGTPTLLGALNIAAARLDAPASLVDAAVEACGGDPTLIRYQAHDAIFLAWKRWRRAA